MIDYKEKYLEKKYELKQKGIYEEKLVNKLSLCENSNRILSDSFVNTLVLLFRKLDHKNLENVCEGNFDLDAVHDPKMQNLALQILQEVQDNNLQLDVAQFVELGIKIFNRLEIPVKNAMLIKSGGLNPTKRQVRQFPFKVGFFLLAKN